MSENPSSPLLGGDSARPTSTHSHHSNESYENTPLLSRTDDVPRYDDDNVDEDEYRNQSPAAASLRSLQNGEGSSKSKGGRRWPTIAAIGLLGVVMISIIMGAFFAPAVVEEYAKESLVVEPTKLSIHEITSDGVIARIQANFKMDASKVKNEHVRNIGRFGTWIARAVETEESTVRVYIKSLDLHVGTALIPKIVVDIRNGHTTALNFLAKLQPGNVDGLRQVANDWLEGRLQEITLRGEGEIGLKSGLLSLGSQRISEELHFEGSDIPAIPEYNITRMYFHEVPVSTNGQRGMAADVSISAVNSYPIGLTIPPLGFEILVPNCVTSDNPYISLADATTGEVVIKPFSNVTVNVGGVVRELPKSLMKTCPGSTSSPLDLLVGDYLAGNDTTVFIRGSNAPDGSTPDWITQIISSVIVPIPFPGHTFDKLIKEFQLKNTKFSLPSPFADDGSDEANPRISGDIFVLAGMPKDMNFDIGINQIRATANVFYKHDLLGELNLRNWQKAHSKRIEPKEGESATIQIESHIEKAPLVIKNQEVFEDVIAAYYLGDGVKLEVKALLEIEVETVLGKFVIKNMPAAATVPLKPISRDGGLSNLKPKVGNLSVVSTDRTTINLKAIVNFTNPTDYSAKIPYFNIHILNNGSIVGDATVRDIFISRGRNINVPVEATWDPTKFGGHEGAKVGRELISQYISGFNTTLTFQTHEGSIPHQPIIGKGLRKFAVTLPTPRLSTPDGDGEDGGKPHFITDATFHVFSSTAQFTLISPLQKSTIFIENINATALYNHTEPVGRILYDLPFKVPPGESQSPKLPVDVDFDSVGYGEIKKALGGTLKLDARGTVAVRLEHWTETIWYVGSGIGASIRF